jgi:hypothetical protein
MDGKKPIPQIPLPFNVCHIMSLHFI